MFHFGVLHMFRKTLGAYVTVLTSFVVLFFILVILFLIFNESISNSSGNT